MPRERKAELTVTPIKSDDAIRLPHVLVTYVLNKRSIIHRAASWCLLKCAMLF